MTNIPLSAVFVIAAFVLFIDLMFRGMHQLIACFITVLITCIASQDGFGYSGAAEPLFRKSGNRLSGIGNRHVA